MKNYKVTIKIRREGQTNAFVKANNKTEAINTVKARIDEGAVSFEKLLLQTHFDFDVSLMSKREIARLDDDTTVVEIRR